MRRERTASFRGGMNDSAASADDFKPEECARILNGRVDFDGSAACIDGSRRTESSSPPIGWRGRGIIEFQPSTGVRQLVRFTELAGAPQAVAVHYSTDSGLTWTEIVTGGIGTATVSLVTMVAGGVAYLLVANGDNTMYSWTGAAWATVAGPTTGIKYLAVFNNRLYATKGNTVVYGSKIDDFNTWASPDGLVLPVNTHDAEPITNIAAAGSVLLVQKRDSTAYIDGFGNSDIIVASGSRGLSRSVGCIAPRTFQPTSKGYVWLSDRGLEYWAGAGSEVQQIALGARTFMTASVAKNRITDSSGVYTGSPLPENYGGPMSPCAVYYPGRDEYWIALPGSAWADAKNTAARNDVGLVVNMTTGAVSEMAWNPAGMNATETRPGLNRLYPDSMCLAEIAYVIVATGERVSYTRPFVLTMDGTPLTMDIGTRAFAAADGTGGHAIDFRMRSRSYDFGEPTRRKWARVVRIAATETVDQTVSVYPVADGVLGAAQTLNFAAAADTKPQLGRVRVSARGLNIQTEIRAAGGFKVSGIEMHADVMAGAL